MDTRTSRLLVEVKDEVKIIRGIHASIEGVVTASEITRNGRQLTVRYEQDGWSDEGTVTRYCLVDSLKVELVKKGA